MALLLLREARAARRRTEALGKEHADLAASNAELAAAKTRADAKTAQLEATLAGMTDGVAMVDASHCLMEWNDLFPEISGVPAEVLRVGASMEEMVRAQAEAGEFGPVDVEAEVARRMRCCAAAGWSETNERARPDGRIIELRRNHLPDGGMVTLYTDITARKQVETALRAARAAAEEASAAKARFVAIVSHEIRTPLNALLNSLQLLAEGETDRRAACADRPGAPVRRRAAGPDQRHPRHVPARSRTARAATQRVRAAPVLTGVLEMLRPAGGATRHHPASGARRGNAASAVHRSGPAAPGAAQPAEQRREVCRAGEVLLIAESIEIDGAAPHLRHLAGARSGTGDLGRSSARACSSHAPSSISAGNRGSRDRLGPMPASRCATRGQICSR